MTASLVDVRMPCSGCRRMLAAHEMVWLRGPMHDPGRRRAGVPIPRVGCHDCAKATR